MKKVISAILAVSLLVSLCGALAQGNQVSAYAYFVV